MSRSMSSDNIFPWQRETAAVAQTSWPLQRWDPAHVSGDNPCRREPHSPSLHGSSDFFHLSLLRTTFHMPVITLPCVCACTWVRVCVGEGAVQIKAVGQTFSSSEAGTLTKTSSVVSDQSSWMAQNHAKLFLTQMRYHWYCQWQYSDLLSLF